MVKIKIMVGILVLCCMAGMAWGAPPAPLGDYAYHINVQGRVTDKLSGIDVPDGAYDFVFTLERSSIGALPAWADAGWAETQRVNVQNGVFNAILGNTTAFPVLDPAYDYRLKISFNGEDMNPPQLLVGVPLALTARNLMGGKVQAYNSDSRSQAIYGLTDGGDSAGVKGEASGVETGVMGAAASGTAVYGTSTDGKGVVGVSRSSGSGANPGVHGRNAASSGGGPGVYGESTSGVGVYGEGSYGLRGDGTSSYGVYGYKANGTGRNAAVYGYQGEASDGVNPGVMGVSVKGHGVYGQAYNSLGEKAGVYGENSFSFMGSTDYFGKGVEGKGRVGVAGWGKTAGGSFESDRQDGAAIVAQNTNLTGQGDALKINKGGLNFNAKTKGSGTSVASITFYNFESTPAGIAENRTGRPFSYMTIYHPLIKRTSVVFVSPMFDATISRVSPADGYVVLYGTIGASAKVGFLIIN